MANLLHDGYSTFRLDMRPTNDHVLPQGAKFSVYVSDMQKFLVVYTYKLCHTAFICIMYKL